MPNNVTKPPILDNTGQSIKSKLSAILSALQSAGSAFIPTSQKGSANGVAELDANGLVPSSQLPSYVDDVLEYASVSAFPSTGETGKIYVALDTNKTYRWSGSEYVEISASLALGETSSTAYRGDRGKTAYDHSQSDHSTIAPAFSEAGTRANIASGESFATLFGKIKKFFTDLTANTNVTYPSGYGTSVQDPYKFGTESSMQGNTFNVFTYAQGIADSLKTAINSHGDKLKYYDNNMAAKSDANGTYNKPIYDSTTHEFNMTSVETNKGAVYMANDAASKLSTAINDHADGIYDDYVSQSYNSTTHKVVDGATGSGISAKGMAEQNQSVFASAINDHADLVGKLRVEKTWAEYQALTNAQKNDPEIIYYITDLDAVDYPVQDDGTATSLECGSVPTGRTLLNILNPVGTVIYSTTCDTMAKVVAAYGGTTWIQHAGYILRGASSGVTANSATKTGGADTVTLSVNEMPAHSHKEWYTWSSAGNVGGNWKIQMVTSTNGGDGNWPDASGIRDVAATGGGQAHNNMQSYKDVYIWERTA